MISLLWFLLPFATTGQQEWTWKAFPESGFKILTPCAMEHTLTKVPTATGHIDYHQYKGGSLTGKDHGTLFTIDHYTLDEAIGGDDAYLEEFFTTTVDEILQSVKGTLIYNERTAHSKRDIYIWKASFDNGKGVVKGQLILAGNKYFGLQVFGLAASKPDEVMNTFFESFQITEQSN